MLVQNQDFNQPIELQEILKVGLVVTEVRIAHKDYGRISRANPEKA